VAEAVATTDNRGEAFREGSPDLLEAVQGLSILLAGSGRNGAGSLLERRDLVELSRMSANELAVEFGLDRRACERVSAAFVLARALDAARRPLRPNLRSAAAVFELLGPRVRGLEQESFFALLLDGKHRLRRTVAVSSGTLTTSLVHPREVFRAAVREAAACVIVAHNHPSGDPEPSPEDLEVTRRLRAAGELLGIPLQDHVILGERTFVSLRERQGL
jgi:DNA repair protein RadC